MSLMLLFFGTRVALGSLRFGPKCSPECIDYVFGQVGGEVWVCALEDVAVEDGAEQHGEREAHVLLRDEFAAADALLDEAGELAARRLHCLMTPGFAELLMQCGIGYEVRRDAFVECGPRARRVVREDGDHVCAGVAGVE